MLSAHNRKLFDELRALNLPPDQFVVFGSGPMGIRGLKEIGDIDLLVTEKLWKELLKTHESKDRREIKLSPHVDAIMIWFPGEWDVDDLIAEADVIDGIRFVKLKWVHAWKSLRMAPKDEKDLKVLEAYFQGQKSEPQQ